MSTELTSRSSRRRDRRRAAVAALALLAAVTGAAVALSGVVPMPDVEALLADAAEALGAWTYLLVGGLAFLETGAFVGLLAPGETAVVLGGAVAARGEVELVPLLALVWVAAAAGDLVSFLLGRRLGRPFLVAHGPRLRITPERLTRVEAYVARHGGKTILIGRFVGVVRAIAPFLAGASGMPLRRFLPFSLLGTGIWSTLFTGLGYGFSESVAATAEHGARAALAVALVSAAGVVIIIRARRRSPTTGTPQGYC